MTFPKVLLSLCLVAFLTAPAHAQTILSRAECTKALTEAKEARSKSDSGPKANKEADELLEVAEHLCGQGNFVYAGNVLAVVRGILATEN